MSKLEPGDLIRPKKTSGAILYRDPLPELGENDCGMFEWSEVGLIVARIYSHGDFDQLLILTSRGVLGWRSASRFMMAFPCWERQSIIHEPLEDTRTNR